MEDFEEFYDAPLEFMDSFERSVQCSTEVKLNGDSLDSDMQSSCETGDILNNPLQNGGKNYENRDDFQEITDGDFGCLPVKGDILQLKKSKYR